MVKCQKPQDRGWMRRDNIRRTRGWDVSADVRSSRKFSATRPAKRYKMNKYNCSWRRRHDRKKDQYRQTEGGSKWAKQRRSSRHSSSSWQSDPGTPGEYINGEDITSYQSLPYNSYIGNETRRIEFKRGGVFYMKSLFYRDACIYGCAFLNSGGGSLLVGVHDNGKVYGVYFDHKGEDDTRLQVDRIVKEFNPPLLPNNYTLQFLPVIKPGVSKSKHKVLCLTFRTPPASSEPTLFQFDKGKVYMRLDGSVYGPLSTSTILEWSRQMWTGKMQQMEHHFMSEIRFLVKHVECVTQAFVTLDRSKAVQQAQEKTTRSGQRKHKVKSSARQNSPASACPSPVGTPDARPAHNTGSPDLPIRIRTLPDENSSGCVV